MKISKEDVIHVAHLARLELDEAAVDKFSHQIGTILDYVDTLNRLEKEVLARALSQCRSTRELAARLKTSQPTVVRKLKKHGLSLR